MPTRLLADEGHEFDVLYANSNIAPREEYDRRLRELEKYGARQGFRVFEGAYDPDAWEREVALLGEKGSEPAQREERCRACYRLRLEEAAAVAREGGYDALTTTLAISPYQLTDVCREELEAACGRVGVKALFEDWRPYYDEATRISRELGMYRQNYCGCRFSVAEAQATRERIKKERAEQKAARAAERAQVDAAAEQARATRAAERRAYDEERARRRAILKQLRTKPEA